MITVDRLSNVGRLLLRHAYKQVLESGNAERRDQRLQRLGRVRRFLHPPGGTHIGQAQLDGSLQIEVNLCEMVGADIYYGVTFEPTETLLVKRLIRPGDVFLDVGANIGMYTLIASRATGPSGMVHAFEPITAVYSQLLRNVEKNRLTNVVANHAAVSEAPGEVELFVNRETALTSLGQTNRGEVVRVEKIAATSLDAYAERHGISQASFLKIDVEGFEGHVLRGAAALLERSADLTILCELAEKNFAPLGLSVDQVIAWLREHNFQAWEIDRRRDLPVPIPCERLSRDNQNFVFVRPGSRNERVLTDISQRGAL